MADELDSLLLIVTILIPLIILVNLFRSVGASSTAKKYSSETDHSIGPWQSNTSADKRGPEFFGHESGVPGSNGNGDASSASSGGINGSGSQN